MSKKSRKGLSRDSSLWKAAALLATLGEKTSAGIIKHLSEKEVAQVTQALTEVQRLTSAEAELVLDEFNQMCVAQQYVVKGGVEYAEAMLLNAFGSEAGTRLLDRIKTNTGDLATFDALQRADPQQLAKFIHNEHPQTIAIILSHVESRQAAALLSSLPPDLQTDVATRMAHLDQISPEIISKIAVVIEQKLASLGEVARESYGGVRAVADMINRLDAGLSKDILSTIEQRDAKLFETIRHLLFVFEDLMRLDVRDLKELIQRVDRKSLTIALKGTSDPLKERILGVMSQRSAEMLKEDMEILGAVKIREVEFAQTQVIQLIREMEKEGTISLTESEYVV